MMICIFPALDKGVGNHPRLQAAIFSWYSAGMDIYDGDPLGSFKVTTPGITEIGKRIAALSLPSVIVMEGGYNNDALGRNITAFLGEFRNEIVYG